MLYYGTGNVKSDSPRLTFVSRPGRTVCFETGPESWPTLRTKVAESLAEGLEAVLGLCLASSLETGHQGHGGGALELSQLAPTGLLGRAFTDLEFSGRNYLPIPKTRWEFQKQPFSLPR